MGCTCRPCPPVRWCADPRRHDWQERGRRAEARAAEHERRRPRRSDRLCQSYPGAGGGAHQCRCVARAQLRIKRCPTRSALLREHALCLARALAGSISLCLIALHTHAGRGRVLARQRRLVRLALHTHGRALGGTVQQPRADRARHVEPAERAAPLRLQQARRALHRRVVLHDALRQQSVRPAPLGACGSAIAARFCGLTTAMRPQVLLLGDRPRRLQRRRRAGDARIH